MQNVMLDVETMGLSSRAAITSLGAVIFDIDEEKITQEFYTNIILSSSVKMGMETDKKTFEWWARDDNKAARDEMSRNQLDLEVAIRMFIRWCHQHSPQGIIAWSYGVSFDIVVLEYAIRSCGMKIPWHYRNISDYRTLKRLYPQVRVPRTSMLHNSIEDARFQAVHLMRILNSINVREEVTTR